MSHFSIRDIPFLGSGWRLISDDFESYSDGAAVNGLNGSTGWAGAYVDRNGLFGLQAGDDMDSYTDGASVNGLNLGNGWTGAYVDRDGLFGLKANDDMDSYTDAASLNGLNGGTGWTGAYVVEPVDTPVASPSYGLPSTVTLSTVLSGTSIYYTTDGSTPTTSSTLYTGAISISDPTNLKAIATKTGYRNSAVGSWWFASKLPSPPNTIHSWYFPTSLLDKVGSANVTNHGGTLGSDGITFNGTSSQYADTSAFSIGSTSFSIVAWLKHTNDSGIVLNQEAVNTGFIVGQTGSTSFDFRGDGSPYGVLSATLPSASAWHQVVFTMSAGNSAKIYIDGSLVAGPTTLNNTFTDASRVLHLSGYVGAPSSDWWAGTFGSLQICNAVLSATDVTNSWNDQRGYFGV